MFQQPTSYSFDEVKIEGVEDDLYGMINELHIFENIYYGGITGYFILTDGTEAGLIEQYDLEFLEPFNFRCTNALDEVIEFEGFLNGIRDERTQISKKVYTIDFVSKSVRQNELTKKVMKSYRDQTPLKIAEEMTDRLESELVDGSGEEGEQMCFTGGNRTPLDVMKYVCNHSVVGNPETKVKEKEGETSGTTGFLYWETLDGYRFAPVDELIKGEMYGQWDKYAIQVARTDRDMESQMNGVLDYEFTEIGDFQSKLQSGAFSSKCISLDLDSGLYTELTYKPDESILTDKMKDIIGDLPTRIFSRIYSNESYNKECKKANDNSYDQSRRYLQQSAARQNTFADQHGRFTLPPRYDMRAGDMFELKVGKITTKSVDEYDKKHSGKYIIKQVGHHFYTSGHSYTKISTIRTTTQQDDSKS